jgi:hypothetical protein
VAQAIQVPEALKKLAWHWQVFEVVHTWPEMEQLQDEEF